MENHQKGDPRMLIIIFYTKILDILTIISDNFDCLKKNQQDR